MKFFRKQDKPCHENLTEDDIFDMRDSIVASAVLLQNGGGLVNENLRETFRSLNSNQAKEVEMALLKRLSMMKETILWSTPKSIFRSFSFSVLHSQVS